MPMFESKTCAPSFSRVKMATWIKWALSAHISLGVRGYLGKFMCALLHLYRRLHVIIKFCLAVLKTITAPTVVIYGVLSPTRPPLLRFFCPQQYQFQFTTILVDSVRSSFLVQPHRHSSSLQHSHGPLFTLFYISCLICEFGLVSTWNHLHILLLISVLFRNSNRNVAV